MRNKPNGRKRQINGISNAPESAMELAKIAKESLVKKEVKQDKPDRSECGLDNPCTFGKHNQNFNPNKSLG